MVSPATAETATTSLDFNRTLKRARFVRLRSVSMTCPRHSAVDLQVLYGIARSASTSRQ